MESHLIVSFWFIETHDMVQLLYLMMCVQMVPWRFFLCYDNYLGAYCTVKEGLLT
jgi:hypothetical protein